MLNYAKLPLAVALTATATAALAQNPGPLNALPETVISATQITTPSDETASSVTVITAEQIEKTQTRTVADLLRTVPGLNVVQGGALGGQTSVFMRGTNSNHVKVLIDGIEINDPTGPTRAFDFGPLTTDDIERIEILRGPQSGLYGADAIGGVISITTKKGKGPGTWRAYLEGGSFGTFNKGAQFSGGTDTSHYAFTISNQHAASVPVTPQRVLPAGASRINDYGDITTYTAKIGKDISENFAVNLVGRYSENQLRYTNFNFFDRDDARGFSFQGLSEGVLKTMDGRLVSNFGVAYMDTIRKTFNAGGLTRFDGDRTKYYWRSAYTIAPGHVFLAGVEHQEEKANNTSPFGGLNGKMDNTGVFAEMQSKFGERILIVGNIRNDNNNRFGDHTTWRITPAFLIHETDTKLKASYGTGFRAPSLYELFDTFSGNPNLRPERSEGYDIGFEQNLFQKRLSFGVTYFHNDIDDLILFPAPLFSAQNIQRAETYGYEAFVAAKIMPTLQLRADYTRTTAFDKTTNLALLRRPQDKTSFTAIWQATDRLDFSLASVWVSNWFDNDRATFSRTLTPGYNVVNLATNYKVNENATVFGRIENLFDKRYENPNGFEQRGLGAYAGVRLKY